MNVSPRWLFSALFALSLSSMSSPPLTADEPKPLAATPHPKGEVRITGERCAIVCVRVIVPLSEGGEASLDECVTKVKNILLDTYFVPRSKAIRLKSLLKADPHPKVKFEAGDISLLEFLVIISQKAGVNIQLTEDEIIFKDGG